MTESNRPDYLIRLGTFASAADLNTLSAAAR